MIRQAREMERFGMKRKDIAAAMGVTGPRISQLLGPKRARREHRARDVVRAKEMRERGLTVSQIGILLGVPRTTVGEWVKPTDACASVRDSSSSARGSEALAA
jgi:predicted transcriptional regulator